MVNTISALIRILDNFFDHVDSEEKLEENYEIKNLTYGKIYPELPWNINHTKYRSLDKLPLIIH